MKKLIIFGLIAILPIAVQAQIVSSKSSRITVTKKPKADTKKEKKPRVKRDRDYNRLYLGYTKMFEDWDDMYGNGAKAGYLHGFSVSKKKPLFVEAGCELNYTKYAFWDLFDYDKKNVLSVDIPVSLTYKHTFKNNLSIAPYAGIDFRLNLLETEVSSLLWSDCNRFQFGGNLGVNIGYKAFNFNIGCGAYTPCYYDMAGLLTVGLGYNF